MRILITGATGLVGNNCLRVLTADGTSPDAQAVKLASERLEAKPEQSSDPNQLYALVRKGHDPRPFEGLDVELITADLSDPEALRAAIPRVDAIIHSAGDTHIGRMARPVQHQINVVATDVLADVARQQGAKFVFVSSVDALPAGSADQPVNEETDGSAKFACGYVTTKREAETLVMRQVEQGLDAIIVNPGFMLGPWDWKPSSGRMLLAVAQRFTPFGPKGGFSVCDVRDVAEAIARMLSTTTSHRRYILAGTNLRYIDAWRVFAKVTGGGAPICPAGPLMRIAGGKWGDLMTKITGVEGDLNSAGVGMSDLYHYYDSSRAIGELNYRIRPIQQSAADAWDWFLEHKYA